MWFFVTLFIRLLQDTALIMIYGCWVIKCARSMVNTWYQTDLTWSDFPTLNGRIRADLAWLSCWVLLERILEHCFWSSDWQLSLDCSPWVVPLSLRVSFDVTTDLPENTIWKSVSLPNTTPSWICFEFHYMPMVYFRINCTILTCF